MNMNQLPAVIRHDAKLPFNYEEARRAIMECERVDEVKEWKDRAAAIASYAQQKRDRTLLDKASRIKARATRRLGELLEEHAEANEISYSKAAERNGVSSSEATTARQVAKVASGTFDNVVERKTPPMPISKIARLAVRPTGGDQSEMIWKVLDRLSAVMREFPEREAVESIVAADPREAIALKKAIGKAVDYLDALATAAERRL
jgi:hypothetical protein